MIRQFGAEEAVVTSEGPEPRGISVGERREAFAQRRPITAFLVLALGFGLPLLTIPAVTNLPFEPFLLALTFVALLGSALVVTRVADGPGAVRKLLSRVLIWRFGAGRWAVILLGMPVLTVLLAAASGTLDSPESGWAAAGGGYLFDTLIFGALILNLWEETAWGGFAQTRLMARHGLLVGSLLTAVPFAVVHVPLHFASGWTWSQAAVGLAVLFVGAPVYRYLLGMHLLDTGGSILAIAVQHASWNAAGNFDFVSGHWQSVAAVLLLTLLVAGGRRLLSGQSNPITRDDEKAAAATWTATRQLLR
jgi:uncharacterized protein